MRLSKHPESAWRSARPVSTISTTMHRREAQAKGLRRHIAAAREHQSAAGHPQPRGRRRHGCHPDRGNAGRGPFPSFCIASPQARSWREIGVELGGYISFSGILTFPKSEDLREIAKTVPHDRLLVETDAPYLAPKRWRGKRNEPAYVVNTARGPGRDDRRFRRRRSPRSPPTTLSACFSKMPRTGGVAVQAALHHSRLRLVSRRAAHHRRLGRLRSDQSEKPPHARRLAGRADSTTMAA